MGQRPKIENLIAEDYSKSLESKNITLINIVTFRTQERRTKLYSSHFVTRKEWIDMFDEFDLMFSNYKAKIGKYLVKIEIPF